MENVRDIFEPRGGDEYSILSVITRIAEVTDCGHYLLVSPQQDCRDNLVFFADLQTLPEGGIKGKIELTQIVFKFENDFQASTMRTFCCVCHNLQFLIL